MSTENFPVGSRVLYKSAKMETPALATVLQHDPEFPWLDTGTLVHIRPDNSIDHYLDEYCISLVDK